MGVGKSVQGIALASCYQAEWPLLVIAPASLRLMWAEEIERWMPQLRPSQVTPSQETSIGACVMWRCDVVFRILSGFGDSTPSGRESLIAPPHLRSM